MIKLQIYASQTSKYTYLLHCLCISKYIQKRPSKLFVDKYFLLHSILYFNYRHFNRQKNYSVMP